MSETHDEPIATPEYIASPVRSGSRERNALAPRGSDVPETESDSSDSEEDERREAEDLGRHKQGTTNHVNSHTYDKLGEIWLKTAPFFLEWWEIKLGD